MWSFEIFGVWGLARVRDPLTKSVFVVQKRQSSSAFPGYTTSEPGFSHQMLGGRLVLLQTCSKKSLFCPLKCNRCRCFFFVFLFFWWGGISVFFCMDLWIVDLGFAYHTIWEKNNLTYLTYLTYTYIRA